MEPKLSIIIVNWNGENVLPGCLKSIAENRINIPYEVVVVDNASTDKSVRWLHSKEARLLFPEGNLKLIENQENVGFGRANNIAIRRTSSPYVFLLNPDTIVKRDAIDRLVTTVSSDKNLGACAPKLTNADGTVQPSVCVLPNPLNIIALDLRLYRFLSKKYFGERFYSHFWGYDQKKDVPIVAGAAIMAKREMIRDIGAFDELYYMYGEDIEWCVRMKRSGWRLLFEPKAEIVHFGGSCASQRWPGETSVKEHESGILVQQACLPKYLVLLNTITRSFIYLLFFLKNFLLRKDTSKIIKIFKIQVAGATTVLLRKEPIPHYHDQFS